MQAGFLVSLPLNMDTFWCECFEQSKMAAHRRCREVGESKLAFASRYLEPFQGRVSQKMLKMLLHVYCAFPLYFLFFPLKKVEFIFFRSIS